mmetsp:Transcript_81868/g.231719  ORF Transcript_81868/g.231719 Transcript_81868/m.231719 type:complete len:246 (-) Transcript_81868:470-1207(-)
MKRNASKASRMRWKLLLGSTSSHSQAHLGSASRWSGLASTSSPCLSRCSKCTLGASVRPAVWRSCSCLSSQHLLSAPRTDLLKPFTAWQRSAPTALSIPAERISAWTAFPSALISRSLHCCKVSTRTLTRLSATPGLRTPPSSSQRERCRLASSRFGARPREASIMISSELEAAAQSMRGTSAWGSPSCASRICSTFLPGKYRCVSGALPTRSAPASASSCSSSCFRRFAAQRAAVPPDALLAWI